MNRKLLFFSILLIANHDIRSMEPQHNKQDQKNELKSILVRLKNLQIISQPAVSIQNLGALQNIAEERIELRARKNELIKYLKLEDIAEVQEEVNRDWPGREEML